MVVGVNVLENASSGVIMPPAEIEQSEEPKEELY
jgi:hypothetical protein